MIPPSIPPNTQVKNRKMCDAYLRDLNQLLTYVNSFSNGGEVIKRLNGIADDAKNSAEEPDLANVIDSKSVPLKFYVGQHRRWGTEEKDNVCRFMRDVVNHVEAFLKRAEISDLAITRMRYEAISAEPTESLQKSMPQVHETAGWYNTGDSSWSNDTASSQSNETNMKLVSLEASLAELKRKLEEENALNATLEASVQAKDKMVQEFKDLFGAAVSECKKLQDKTEAADRKYKELQEQKRQLEQTHNDSIAAHKHSIEALNAKLRELEEVKQRWAGERDEKRRLEQALYNTIEAHEAELERLKVQYRQQEQEWKQRHQEEIAAQELVLKQRHQQEVAAQELELRQWHQEEVAAQELELKRRHREEIAAKDRVIMETAQKAQYSVKQRQEAEIALQTAQARIGKLQQQNAELEARSDQKMDPEATKQALSKTLPTFPTYIDPQEEDLEDLLEQATRTK